MFYNRADAGDRLGCALLHLVAARPVVVGLPRGGIAVAAGVAVALHAPLDFICARKIGAPQHPEYAIGAVAPGGVVMVNEAAADEMGVDSSELTHRIAVARHELDRQVEIYRGVAPHIPLLDQSVVLVDDGLATGLTMRAAIASLRFQSPRMIVVAVPVGSPKTVALVSDLVDEVVCLQIPPDFDAVGPYYEDFGQMDDDDVVDLLRSSRHYLGS